jgi:DNA-binding Lrp family transcriptional regulator
MPLAFVLVKARAGKEAEAHHALESMPGVAEVHPLLGDHDFLCKVEAPDFDAVGRLVVNGVRALPGVASIRTLTADPVAA